MTSSPKISEMGQEFADSFHPGTALKRLMFLEDTDLATVVEATGASTENLRALMNREHAISEDLVPGLVELFKYPAIYWHNLQLTYDMECAREKRRAAAAQEVDLLPQFNVEAAIALGWLPPSRDERDHVIAAREFLGVDRLADFEINGQPRLRIAGSRDSYTSEALGMWLRQGEIEAARRDVGDFKADRFEENLPQIRKFSMRSPFSFLPAMTDLCADAGVAFVVVEHLPSAGAKGATCWSDDGKPRIQMTFKANWLDNFWCAFYHEAAHVLRGCGTSVVHVDGDLADGDLPEADVLDELEVERCAQDLLIPRTSWRAMLIRPEPNPDVIEYISTSVGVHPGIIVGRLQREGLISWSNRRFNRFKTKVTLTERKALSETSIRHQAPDAAASG